MMKPDRRFDIAHRIHLLLRRELGQGIEVPRMLAEPLYARDVLLVCEALPRTELPALRLQFLQTPADPAPPSTWASDSSGFDAAGVPHPALAQAPRHWLSPARWLGLR